MKVNKRQSAKKRSIYTVGMSFSGTMDITASSEDEALKHARDILDRRSVTDDTGITDYNFTALDPELIEVHEASEVLTGDTVWVAMSIDELRTSSDIVTETYATHELAIDSTVKWIRERMEVLKWNLTLKLDYAEIRRNLDINRHVRISKGNENITWRIEETSLQG